MKFKRGYQNGAKTLEIIDGNLDVVLYHEDESGTFYFYRFPADIIANAPSKDSFFVADGKVKVKYMESGEEKVVNANITSHKQMKSFLERRELSYDTVLNRLLELAMQTNMKARYDM